MPLSVPPELKKIKVFIQRAEELDRAKSAESRVVAFYCRQWAVQQGIPLSTSSDVAKGCLGELLGQLEGEKQAMSVFSRVESRQICRNFAEQIFEKANAEDRSGGADKGTARTFYASASFFEILQQFNEDVGDAEGNAEEAKEDEQKRLYAKWKATEILKALREGRMPTPGAYGEELGGEEDKEDDEGGGAESETSSQEETPANIEPEPEPEPEPESALEQTPEMQPEPERKPEPELELEPELEPELEAQLAPEAQLVSEAATEGLYRSPSEQAAPRQQPGAPGTDAGGAELHSVEEQKYHANFGQEVPAMAAGDDARMEEQMQQQPPVKSATSSFDDIAEWKAHPNLSTGAPGRDQKSVEPSRGHESTHHSPAEQPSPEQSHPQPYQEAPSRDRFVAQPMQQQEQQRMWGAQPSHQQPQQGQPQQQRQQQEHVGGWGMPPKDGQPRQSQWQPPSWGGPAPQQRHSAQQNPYKHSPPLQQQPPPQGERAQPDEKSGGGFISGLFGKKEEPKEQLSPQQQIPSQANDEASEKGKHQWRRNISDEKAEGPGQGQQQRQQQQQQQQQRQQLAQRPPMGQQPPPFSTPGAFRPPPGQHGPPPGQHRAPPGQQQQQGPPQYGGTPPGYPYGQNPGTQYSGQYGGQPPHQGGGQLIPQNNEAGAAVKEALGKTWQGVLGFGRKAREEAAKTKDEIVANAQTVGQNLSQTSSGT